MTNQSTKTVAVLGALGAQGGSVVQSFLADGSFDIRAVTRSVDSDAAKELEKKGVEIVAGDVKQPESLTKAFTGADIAFIVVNFWDPSIMAKELELTKSIMDVAKECGVKHVIYSALANVDAVAAAADNDQKFDVPHFTMKAQAFDYAKTLGFEYVTAVEPAYYYSNWFAFFKPTAEEDGALVWNFPGENKISQYSTGDTGKSVITAAKNPEEYNNKYILLEGDYLTPEESVAIISKKIGKPTRVNYVEPETFATFFPGAHEVSEMVRWFDAHGYYGPENSERKRDSGKKASGGKMQSFEEWLDTKEYEKYLE